MKMNDIAVEQISGKDFSTQKSQRPKLGSLEVGRFVAALAVMLSHFTPDIARHAEIPSQHLFGGYICPGPLGLQYFFTLSGFVMASAHYKDFGKFGAVLKFWWRRACRIYPVYWLALCIPIYYLHRALTPQFTLHLFSLEPWDNNEFIPAAWSLRFEVSFYIMFGLCLMPYVGKPILALWVFLTFWRWCPQSVLPYLHLPIPFALNNLAGYFGDHFVAFFEFFFFAGLAGGWAYRALELGPRTSIILLGCGLLSLAFSLPELNWGAAYGPPMFMIFTGFVLSSIMLGLAGLERHNILRLGKTASILGAMSYPLYMVHEPLMLVMDQEIPDLKLSLMGLYGLFAFGLAVIFSVAAGVTFFFDKPVQSLLRAVSTGKIGCFRFHALRGCVD